RSRSQAGGSRKEQNANAVRKLKEARNPAHTTIAVTAQEQRVLVIRRKASAAPAVARELSQLNSPSAVILARSIQKLPMSTTSVANVFAVRLTVLSRQTGTRSRETVIKSSPSPTKKS